MDLTLGGPGRLLSLSGNFTLILLGTMRPRTQALESEERLVLSVPTEFPPTRSGLCHLQTPVDPMLFQNTALNKLTLPSATTSEPLVLISDYCST